jgi:hypothetical protein
MFSASAVDGSKVSDLLVLDERCGAGENAVVVPINSEVVLAKSK